MSKLVTSFNELSPIEYKVAQIATITEIEYKALDSELIFIGTVADEKLLNEVTNNRQKLLAIIEMGAIIPEIDRLRYMSSVKAFIHQHFC